MVESDILIKILSRVPAKELLVMPGFREEFEWSYSAQIAQEINAPTENMTDVVINKLELASNLAHIALVNNMADIYLEEELYNEGGENYIDQAQDVFNEYYSYYLNQIEEVTK